jgi:hypothetical protein
MTPGLDAKDVEKLEVMAGLAGASEAPEDASDDPAKGSHSVGSVDEELCALIQACYEDHGSHILAKKLNMSKNTVYYHATGECVHKADGSVDEALCATMRAAAADGHNHSDLNRMFDRCPSRWAARYHCTGECACDHSVPPVPAQGRGAWADTE